MKSFEYKIMAVKEPLSENDLNIMGYATMGWELVSVLLRGEDITYFFKREVEARDHPVMRAAVLRGGGL